MEQEIKTKSKTYVAYDKKTGRIVHTHRVEMLESYDQREDDAAKFADEVREDAFSVGLLTDADPKNLEVLSLDNDPPERRFGLRVDVRQSKLVEKPTLKLVASKSELDGDGRDQTEIEITAHRPDGSVAADIKGPIKVSTSRGKLSTRGGLVELKEGYGKITLTSVNETVRRVQVTAACRAGVCQQGTINLEFV